MKKLLRMCVLLACVVFWTAAASSTAELDLSQGSIEISASGAVQNGVSVTAARFRIVQSGGKTTNSVTVSGGTAELILSGLNVESEGAALSVAPGATLTATLEGANALWSTGSAGIRVPPGASLSLGGQGSLTAVGRNHSAGIGGGFREDSGRITVTGGTVTATGVGAGIGGGTNGIADITITGGTVTANGGGLSAGLGGGFGATKVTITGGNVTARGSSNGSEGGGAGIGNCNYGSGAVIVITGGSITAKGGPGGGAGIGGGDHGAPASVHISGATVTATGGGFSSGIGGGARTAYDQTGGDVRIENSSVTVTGYYSAIGGGSAQNNHGCTSIILENCDMTASCKAESGILYNEKLLDPKIDGPLQHSVAAGEPTRLKVTAQAPSGITCQWQVSPNGTSDWEELPGTAAISEFSITREQSGKYFRCLLTNAYGSTAYAGPIRIYALAYTLQPVSVRTEMNTSATLTAGSDTPNVTWHWERSTDFGATYTPIDGATGSSLTVSVTESLKDAFYRCGITGTGGHVLYSEGVRVCEPDAPCYYRVITYQQELNGTYVILQEETVDAEAGTRVSVKAPQREGFAFNANLGLHLGTVREDCSLVLTVYYDRLVTTVSFETGGVSQPEPVTAMYGAAITLPTPETEGGVFAGWYTDPERTVPAVLTTMPAGDTVLYGLWQVEEAARGLEYRIGGLLILPSEEGETAPVPAGAFSAQVVITNLSSLCADTVVLTVHDEAGRQLETYWSKIRADVGEMMAVTFSVENQEDKASTISVFILSSGTSMKPLSRKATFGQEPLFRAQAAEQWFEPIEG